jgi:hypothetical protein
VDRAHPQVTLNADPRFVEEQLRQARREFAEALQYQAFARDLFEGFPQNGTHDAVLDADEGVGDAIAILEEWEI